MSFLYKDLGVEHIGSLKSYMISLRWYGNIINDCI